MLEANNELELKELLESTIEKDFIVLKEVKGFNQVENRAVRIDYICKARQNIVDIGFTNNYFGIEVKHINDDSKKWRHLLVQSITYSMSVFYVEKQVFRPDFVLVFSNTDKFNTSLDTVLASYFNVGILQRRNEYDFEKNKSYYNGEYAIKFSTQVYYESKVGIKNKNCALNRYCGTWT